MDRLDGEGDVGQDERAGRWTAGSTTGGYQVLRVDELDDNARHVLSRRRRRRAILFVTLPGLLLGTATVATAYGSGLIGQEAVECVPERVAAPERDAFGIDLLNSNDTAGLAGQVSRTLTERGFTIDDVGNADDKVYVKGSATIYYGKESRDNALLVQQQIPGSKIWSDGRAGKDVRVILGYGFTKLSEEAEPPPPAPSEIKVNVYNTTFREGLAKQVADELGARGFREGETGNDPRGAFLPDDTAVIRFGPDGDKAAQRLAEHLGGARLDKVEDRTGEAVDLVLGSQYSDLVPVTDVPQVKPFVRPPDMIERPCQTP